jgi:hypothetical protein
MSRASIDGLVLLRKPFIAEHVEDLDHGSRSVSINDKQLSGFARVGESSHSSAWRPTGGLLVRPSAHEGPLGGCVERKNLPAYQAALGNFDRRLKRRINPFM